MASHTDSSTLAPELDRLPLMNSPGITRGRRAFLAPIWLSAVAVLLTSALIYGVVRVTLVWFADTTSIVLVRHAEKDESTDDSDPLLSLAGQERALRLASMLGDQTWSAIYVSDTRRAELTAAPLAARLGLAPSRYAAGDLDSLLAEIGERHAGGQVLIVGHSNTVPQLVETLTRGRKKAQIDESQYDALFVVTVTRYGPPAVLQLRY